MSVCHIHPLPYRDDPSCFFERVRDKPGAVLLDSGHPQASRGRFDLISAWPRQLFSALPDEPGRAFFARLRQALTTLGRAEPPEGIELPFAGGFIGYLSYDFGRRLEALPDRAHDDLNMPDACLGLYDWALISDHQQRTSQLLFHPGIAAADKERVLALFASPASNAPVDFKLNGPFRTSITRNQYRQAINRVQAYIQAGDCYQVNYTQRFQATYSGDPWAAYLALRTACPTPFAGYLTLPGNNAILSLSPERFLKASDGRVETRPIKGTRPRGVDAEDDAQQARLLLGSPKDRAENLMIVDLLRNDLGRSCRIGSVRVPELFALESYPNVHHLVSAVTGELAAGKDVLDLLAGSFPGGSITGAPKIRAMQIIDELEPSRRALYCGSLLYLDVRGEMDSSITIRSLQAANGTISCWAGGGIVADSDWQAEYEESLTKVRVLLNTLEQL
ncbi:aminodeoxychorismate synthase component I [Pseudomonas sp. LRF_L74]|uniref:aminodeoxychorismate synthase component I n=1 Tax=Pseudomonas sp. LRF_L74 TaxID=3369422 RepID=UPI003F647FB6